MTEIRNIIKEEVLTPGHDVLILELLNKKYVEKLFPKLKGHIISIDAEVPIWNCIEDNKEDGFIIGFWDIVIRTDNVDISDVYIKVKPKEYGFITTMRILRDIMIFTKVVSKDFYLYTPDTTSKSAFESQGFKVITPLK